MMRASWFISLRSFATLLCAAGVVLSLAAPLAAAPVADSTGILLQEEKVPSLKATAKRTEPRPELPRVLDVVVDKSVPVMLPAPASTVFIANPEIADVQVVTPTRIMVYGKKAGETTLLVSDESGNVLAQRTVIVNQNLAELRQALKAISPSHPIKVEAVPNGLILSGEVASASVVEEARRLSSRYIPKENSDIINRIKVSANNQIHIRVRFAEVSREADKRFGIDWETVGNIGGFAVGLATGADFITAGATAITRTTVGNDVNDAFSTSFNNNHFSVNAMVDALAKDGLVTILAEPSLTALSGETASFLAGGEFPVPVPQSANTITIEWKQYGVSLAFTPTIVGDGRINLHVRPEVSQLTTTGSVTLNDIVVPALTTRRAETTLELNSGQSFALAGLLNNQQNQSVSKFPFLGDIPVLGPLFRSTRFQNNESELVIIITPYIVKPSTQERLALPTDNYSSPSDTDRIFRLRETNSDPNARPLSGETRAIRMEEPKAADAPIPTASPLTPVSTSKAAPATTPVPARSVAEPVAPLPMSSPTPVAKKSAIKTPRPSGPGGFIME